VLSPSCGARAARRRLIVVHPQSRLSPPKGGNNTRFVLRYVYANCSKCPGDWIMTGLFLKAGSTAPRHARSRLSTWCVLVVLFHSAAVKADETPEIAKQAQNPIASLISVPFQNNTTFGVGESSRVQDSLLIEPVVPFRLTSDWNLITRTIVPLIEQPTLAPGLGNVSGLGDVQLSLYMSPAKPFGGLIWGLGPSFSFATASDRSLGAGKNSAGLSTALLTIKGPWLVGVLITDVASIGGQDDRKSVHQFLMQPFLDYNFPKGWYLASSPIITADWRATSGNKWTVPLGGGGGKILHIGHQAVNAYVQAFDDVVRPHQGGTWTLRLQAQLLFPK
jgi:hypothetical protein